MTDVIQMFGLSAVAIACGLLSPFLVLKKMTMFANSLSHTILLGITIAFLITGQNFFDISNLFLGALISAIFTAALTGILSRVFRVAEDASIGLSFSALFALGITVVTVCTRDVHLGIEAVMGNVDVLQAEDIQLVSMLVLINLFFVVVFYKRLKLVCFDQHFARSLQIKSAAYHFLLLFLTAITCTAAFRAVGVLLVLSFLVAPFFIARFFCSRLHVLLILTPLIGVAVSLFGVGFSRGVLDIWGFSLSTGGLIASFFGLFYLLAYFITSCSQFFNTEHTEKHRETPRGT